MRLKGLLTLQLVYMILGIGYNAVSYGAVLTGRPRLSATEPVAGAVSMAVYGLFLIPGALRWLKTYRVLMLIALLVFGYGGVVKHILNLISDPSLYSSIWAWGAAVGINLFGLILNFIAVGGWFKNGKV
ncbi:MAG: hypothetical protein JW984_03535 [Deltaproteobacteria bacterium]|uniref:Uncharacterized protein n=1 Tax=Candidatus Zymogenus saltonus TaxID=2844893 RepID=A0A9D8PMX0_9DELT|nr:hypothetical protein [Candidatus Zymogenus saltonus]